MSDLESLLATVEQGEITAPATETIKLFSSPVASNVTSNSGYVDFPKPDRIYVNNFEHSSSIISAVI